MNVLDMLGEWWVAQLVKGRKGEQGKMRLERVDWAHWSAFEPLCSVRPMCVLVDWLFHNRLLFFAVSQPWWKNWSQICISRTWVLLSFQRPRDSQRWTDTNQKPPASQGTRSRSLIWMRGTFQGLCPYSGHYPDPRRKPVWSYSGMLFLFSLFSFVLVSSLWLLYTWSIL